MCKRWGIRTLGELAALPPGELSSRLGQHALAWQAIARGEDAAPLVPTLPEERFESSLDLEWPIEGLEPLSFVLTRLLEPLSARLERRDRGAAILHLELRLIMPLRPGVDAIRHERHLQLPSPIRDVRTLRTLLLLDLDSHPPPAAVDRVTIVDRSDAGPRRAAHALYARAADAGAALDAARASGRADGAGPHRRAGHGRFVPSRRVRDGAVRDRSRSTDQRRARRAAETTYLENSASSRALLRLTVVSALRRCRQPVPARAVDRARAAHACSRPTAAASRAERCASRPARGARQDTGGRERRRRRRSGGSGRTVARRTDPACPARDRAFLPSGTATNGMSRSPTARCIACSGIGRPAGGSSMASVD